MIRNHLTILMLAVYVCISAVILSSCGSMQLAVVKAKPRANDINIKFALREFLKTNPNPSILLRVPRASNTQQNVTAEDLSKQSFVYGRLEKNLDRAGFPIRDRGLVEQLLIGGSANYAEIYKVTGADLIIEIMSLNLNYANNPTQEAVAKKTGRTIAKGSKINLEGISSVVRSLIICLDRKSIKKIINAYINIMLNRPARDFIKG